MVRAFQDSLPTPDGIRARVARAARSRAAPVAERPSGRLQLPECERGSFAQPETDARFREVASQPAAIPVTRAQVHLRVSAPGVAVVLPVELGQCAEVQDTAAQSGKIIDRAAGGPRIEILQHVITDDEIERRSRAVLVDLAVLPTVALAQVLARLEPRVLRTW